MDSTLLQMAILGFEAERQKIQEKIADLQRQLRSHARTGRVGAAAAGNMPTKRLKRTMSAAARKRIAAAQKKRWAEYRKKQQAA